MHRELCFVKKNGFNMSMGRGLGRFSFRPNRTRGGHLKHDFRLTERLLLDSTMTYRGRSDGLVVESDRKSSFTRLTRILRLYIRSLFFFFPRQCVAPIALMDKPPLMHCLNKNNLYPFYSFKPTFPVFLKPPPYV